MTSNSDFKCLHVKSESVWHLSFQEERLNMNWNGNLDRSIGSDLEIRGSNPGSGSNFSLEIKIVNSSRHKIYRLNLNYESLFSLNNRFKLLLYTLLLDNYIN